jgi:hypothetical protein
MRKQSIIALSGIITLLVIAFSCENGASFGVDCNECYYDRPDSADLIIYITINSENPYVPIKLFRGDVENNQLDWVDTVYSKEYRLYSEVGQTYSVEAKYKSGSKDILAVDGDKISTSLVTDVCDQDCWIIKGGILDVRLKEE